MDFSQVLNIFKVRVLLDSDGHIDQLKKVESQSPV